MLRTLILGVVVFSATVRAGLSQQNLFNVPSSDITLKNKFFFQQQFNINKDLYQSNTTLCYGLGKNSEIGINIIGLNVNTRFRRPLFLRNTDLNNPPVYPLYTINTQKAWVMSKLFKLALGTQTGFASQKDFGSFSYLNVVTIPVKWKSKIITGFYYATKSFLGAGTRNWVDTKLPVGIQLGLEQTIIEEKLFFIAENISGRHSLGETTIGGAFYISGHWVLSAGYQFANPGSATLNVGVMELTYVPSASTHKKIFRHGHIEKSHS